MPSSSPSWPTLPAESQPNELWRVFEEAPVAVALFRGPRYVVEWANPAVCAMWGRTPAQALGTPLFELLPEAAGQGFEELLDAVLATGVPCVAHEQPSFIDRDGRRDTVYWNFVYYPLRAPDGRISGVTVVATDASEQVLARQQVQALNQQLATANAALLATNAELQRHNHTLDARVAERTAAAQAARAEAEMHRGRLERLLHDAPAAVCVLAGPDLVFELVNPVYQQLLPGRQLLGLPLRQALPEVSHHAMNGMLRHVYATGIAHEEQGMLVPVAAPDGGARENRYFNFQYQPRYDEHLRIDGVLVFAFEVTEQVQARQEVERQQRVLHALFMEAPGPIVIFDGPELVYQLVNPAYQRIFPSRVLLGLPLLVALPELVETDVAVLLRGTYETGETAVAEEMPLRLARTDGGPLEQMYWTFTYQARRDAQGAVDGVVVFAHDMTSQVRARQAARENGEQVQALNQRLGALTDKLYAANADLANANEEMGTINDALGTSNQQLTHTNADLDNFVYAASHDLKAPIDNLDGLLRALREELPPAAQPGQTAHILRLMQDAVDRFLHTIEQLSTIGHLQQEPGQLLAPTRLAEVVRDVRLDLSPLIAAAGAEVTVAVAGFPSFPFSEKNLRSVVYNLLSNALKYRHPDRPPVVHLRCYLEAPYWVLEVKDNGLGLALGPDRPLFGLFQRLHTHVEGSGVGLFMVKKMVESAGGHVTVQSELGVGSTFSVYFKH